MKFACYLLFAVLTLSSCSKAPDPQQVPTLQNVSSLQCHNDTDCKGDRVCETGICLSPEAASNQVQSIENIKTPDNVVKKAVEITRLDDMFKGLENGCGYNYDAGASRIFEAYMGKESYPPKLVRPEGDKRIAPYLGKANFVLHEADGYYDLTVPATDATLYGIPVSQIHWYSGLENGINGVEITFSIPLKQVKKDLENASIKFQSDAEMDFKPKLDVSETNSSHTVLTCDSST